MDVETGFVAALVLGFLLGLKHATDADHVVAVSTIVGESRNVWRGVWIGGAWGLGHTTPLMILGVVILAFRGLLSGYESIAHIFEFGVGVMMVLLGVQVFWNLARGRLHVHQHSHDSVQHVHIHGTHGPEAEAAAEVESGHGFFHLGRPFFRVKSYSIGVVHGLAGSAAVMLVLLQTLPSFWAGIGYLVLFGIGTVLSMGIITVLLSVPFALVGNKGTANRAISAVAGSASVLFGAALMSDISLGTGFVPF